MNSEAIDRYHELLSDLPAQDTEAALNSELLVRRCYFGTRPLCTVLRPHFYEPQEYAFLKQQTELVLSAFMKAHHACMKDPNLRAQLDLESYEEVLFSLDIGYEHPWTTSRLDSFYHAQTGLLQFVEYNAETPAGMAYEDQLAEAFLSLDVMKRFQKQYVVRRFSMVQGLLESLQAIYREYGGTNAMQIGIIDWADVPTLNEHELCKMYFEARGVPTLLADPRALEYRNGALWAGDFRIDLIYKRVLCSELIQRMGLDNPIVRAVRDRAVCMSNAFSAKLMAKKASFALISDERNAYLFTPAERAAIEAHIPWTRRVQDRKTLLHGKEIELLPYIAEHREHLVLKPNDEYGGKGVVIGWETSQEQWIETLRGTLTTPFVVQERVEAAYEDFPAMINGKLNISQRLVDADPFIFFGQTTNGCLTRLSSSALLNVTAGGGSVVPTFLVHKRK
ncbi:MAG: circularly permuted type 2 ATP-grasp protein [Anaerolineae bacterium]